MGELLSSFVLHLRKRIIFSKNRWEFSFYFQKMALVLFYSSFQEVPVDTFPCKDFFLHASYSRPDEVDFTNKDTQDSAFVRRFVKVRRPREAPSGAPLNECREKRVYENKEARRRRLREEEEEADLPLLLLSGPKKKREKPVFRGSDPPKNLSLLTGENQSGPLFLKERPDFVSTSRKRVSGRASKLQERKAQPRELDSLEKLRRTPGDFEVSGGLSNLTQCLQNPRPGLAAAHGKRSEKQFARESGEIFVENKLEDSPAKGLLMLGIAYSTPQKKNWRLPESGQQQAVPRYFSSKKKPSVSRFDAGQFGDSPAHELPGDTRGQAQSNAAEAENEEPGFDSSALEKARSSSALRLEGDSKADESSPRESVSRSPGQLSLDSGKSIDSGAFAESEGASGLPETSSLSELTRHLQTNSLKIIRQCKRALHSTFFGEAAEDLDTPGWLGPRNRGKAVALLDRSIRRLNGLQQKVESERKAGAPENPADPSSSN